MSAHFTTLASVEAIRPVFLIVMGVCLALIAWRLAKSAGVWTARCLMGGALLLACGYSVLLPLYAAGVLRPYVVGSPHGNPADAMAWQAVKVVIMNSGWLLFGTGLALHANLLQTLVASPRKRARSISPHESVA